jgi:dolichol-phosphate mannosyltransferase
MVDKIKWEFSISVCVPAFNEGAVLREAVKDLFETLSSRVATLEIIIVNDGSTDATATLAQELSRDYDRKIKVIHHPVNLGLGASYKDALSIAQGQYFTWFPGDHENSAEELVQCLPYLRQDTAVTSYHGVSDKRSWPRRVTSSVYTGLLNKCFGLNIKYYNGLTIFPTSVLHSFPLISNGFALSAESLIRAIKSGCKVVELFYPLKKRQVGRSNAISFLSLLGMVKDIGRNLIFLIRKTR